MIAVLQRVRAASVISDGVLTGRTGRGLFILLGVRDGDTEEDARLLAEKIARLRIFSDENGKMNIAAADFGGEALVVSNFTLCADYAHGNRPSYFGAAHPSVAEPLYNRFVTLLAERLPHVATGCFGADMQITSEADGPVTIVMDSAELSRGGAK